MSEDMMLQSMMECAMMGLEHGCLQPVDREILSAVPLSADIIDPYAMKEVPDVLESMNLTFGAMKIWIEEAKKADYFSPRFVQLSKLVMNGVTLMGRGLITLHARGESLAQAPMSIRDLIGVASYHFRKSYLGVLQTSAKNPEIGERLLTNQIAWNNMLMRLFRTREKLAAPARIAGPQSLVIGHSSLVGNRAAAQQLEGGALIAAPQGSGACFSNAELARIEAPVAGADCGERFAAPQEVGRGIAEVSAVGEPGALSAPRAFSSFDVKKCGGKRSDALLLTGSGQSEVKGTKAKRQEPERIFENDGKDEGRENGSAVPDRTKDLNHGQPEVKGTKAKRQQKIDRIFMDDGKDEDRENGSAAPDRTEDGDLGQPEVNEAEAIRQDDPPGRNGPEEGIGESGPDDPGPAEGGRPDPPPPIRELPLYLQILRNAYSRSGPSEQGGLIFTYDEICYLVSDLEFCKLYPRLAADLSASLNSEW